jgi:putative transposase
MKKSKFSETQIIAILKAVEAGRTVRDVCRKHAKPAGEFGSL